MPQYNERLAAEISDAMLETMQGLYDCGCATLEELNEMKALHGQSEHEAYLRMLAAQPTYGRESAAPVVVRNQGAFSLSA